VEQFSLAVTAGTPVFVIVDGFDGGPEGAGPFDLRLDLHL
jgi:hypothetical protein